MSNGMDAHGPMLSNILDEVRNIRERVETMDARLTLILEKEDVIMSAMDDLVTDVTAEDTAIDSAIVLIQGFSAQLAAAGVDPVKLAALRSDIQSRTQALAAAVAAGTPAGPTGATGATGP